MFTFDSIPTYVVSPLPAFSAPKVIPVLAICAYGRITGGQGGGGREMFRTAVVAAAVTA